MFVLAWTASWRAGLVALIAALIWMAHFDRWSIAAWQLPTDYAGDAHETLARLKAASEGDVVPMRPQVITRLGAPFGAHWNDYPAPDKPLMLLLGALVHAVGLHAAANLGLLLAQVGAALAFYFTARWLRCRWEWAAAGALLFAYTYHTFHRGLAHFSLIFTWTVPLGLLAVWLVARSRQLTWRSAGCWVCLGASVALGVSNPYNLFFWLQLMGWAWLLQAMGPRQRANLQIGAACIATAVGSFLVMHAEGWLHAEDSGARPLLARNYSGTEVYALKAVEMVVPPPYHRWETLAAVGDRYTSGTDWRGEPFLPYLGLAGIAGAVWLTLAALRNIVTRRPVPGQSLAIGWILTYATVGGLTNLLAFFASFQLFRATNRAAIFISALVLFFLVVRLSRLTATWPRPLVVLAAMLLAGIGVYEQLPDVSSRPDLSAIARAVTADRAFAARLEAELPPHGMVFQLPVLGFPEVVPPHQLVDYEHFRPYLITETLRFSYGAAKYRARSRWQREIEESAPAAMVAALESHGFAALYINRKGYADRAEGLLRELEQLGYAQRITSAGGSQVVVPLRPAATPRPPLAQAFTPGRGWHLRPANGIRWAYGNAALSYFNPHSYPIQRDITLTLVAASPRTVTLTHEGRPVRQVKIGAEPVALILPQHELRPGVNRFQLRSSAPAIRAGTGSNRQLRDFGLAHSTVGPPGSLRPAAPDSGSEPAVVIAPEVGLHSVQR